MAVDARREDRDPLATFPNIEIRETPAGRRPYLRGTRLGVWHIAALDQCVGPDAPRIAEHFSIEAPQADEALAYIDAHRGEIAAILRETESYDFERVREILPAVERYQVDIGADSR